MPISRRAFGLGALAAPAFLRAARPVPKVLVLLALEEFRSDYLERNRASFGRNGLRRLTDEGCYFPDCRMSASSFTSSGLATLATGAWPQSHGIVADNWYDPATRRMVRARPEALEATGLADQIAQDPKSRIYAIGLDARHAALLAGSRASALFAMDASGDFVVRGSAPVSWFGAFQRANPPANLRNAAWVAIGARTDLHPLRQLNYDPARPQDFVFLYQASPFGQAAQFELAREVIVREALGQGGGIDYLAVTAGSTALLGYDVGADSPLIDQLVLHLDREIEKLVDTLNNTVGAGSYALVFTAAHGGPPQPLASDSRKAVSGDAVARAIEKALAERFKPVTVDRYVYPFLYLRFPPGVIGDRRPARLAAAHAAMQVPGVAGYFTADSDCSHGGDWQQRFRNSFHVQRSGDVMLSYAPGWVEDFGAGRGISYGSLYNYDCRIPLILYGAQLQFRPRTYEQPIEAIDIAPTMARIAGRGYPSSTTGRVLAEAFE